MTVFRRIAYQDTTLEALRQYLALADGRAPEAAFELYQAANPNHAARGTYRPADGLAAVPYVCLRLPTGGGKTYLATQTIDVIAKTIGPDHPLIVWLVPTNTIRQQTYDTLTKPGHPNREALAAAFGDQFVRVLDIADFTQLHPSDLRDKTCIVISTLAVPRIGDTDERRIYAHHEDLEPHFARFTAAQLAADYLDRENDQVKYSFRNLLALHRPVVIVDEAHNASSSLSVETLGRLRPRGIIEFTATPADNSNILHHVSASQLKAEDMIKLPIVLTEHQTWQAAVSDSVRTRDQLHELARLERDYVHPIVLIQAESKDKEVTVEVIKQYLMDEERIASERIAIATGTQRELDDIDLLDPNNPIEYVITIEALKEGWDCPFAYVFCSVATVHNKRDVEQLLGRVLRMPWAKKRTQPDLNRAYAHVSSSSWPQAVSQLHDRLVNMGFDAQEVNQFIQPQLPLAEPTPTASRVVREGLQFTYSAAPDMALFTLEEQSVIQVIPTASERVIMQVSGPVSPELEQKLIQAAPKKDRVAVEQTFAVYRQQRPRRAAEPFSVPQLCLLIDGQWEAADEEWFIDERGWDLLGYPAELSAGEFAVEETSTSYLIDLQGERLVEKYLGSQLELDLNTAPTEWDRLKLSRHLDERLRKDTVRQAVMLEFIRRTLDYLIDRRQISLTALIRTRTVLQRALAAKIKAYELAAYDSGYQTVMFGTEYTVETRYAYAFKFDPDIYPANWFYSGSYQFSDKHLYPSIGELKSQGEEFDCAQAIDRCSHVKRWVRNLPLYGYALPLAKGNFYPDFVAELYDGRLLIVEYKGEHLEDYEQEKRNIGERWEECDPDKKALFLWAVKRDPQGRDVYQQLEDKILGKK